MKATIIYSSFRYFLHYFVDIEEYYEIMGRKIIKKGEKEEILGCKTLKEAKEYYSILNDKEKEKAFIYDIAKKEKITI